MARPPEGEVPKRQVSARIDADVARRADNCAYWIGRGLTFSGMLEEGLRAFVEELEAEYNGGKPFKDKEDTPAPRRKKR